MTSSAPAFVDFESRSKAKLKDVGGRNYAADPSTDVVCGVLRMPDGEDVIVSPFAEHGLQVEVGGRFEPVLRDFEPPRLEVLIAHNSTGFDRYIWRKLGWPEPRRWVDSSYIARVAGMPEASLEWLAENLLARPKDLEGSKLTQSLSAVSRAQKTMGQFRVPLTRDVLTRVIQYCWLDVDLLPELWWDWLAEWEGIDLDGFEAAQIAMNDRGICFDSELARDLLDADAILGDAACKLAKVPRTLVTSDQQMRKEMARLGWPVPNAQAETFAAVLLEPDLPKAVQLLVEARLACKSIAAGKLRKGLVRVSPDGRLRDNTRIYGAHTGRESGQHVQLQNLAGGPRLDLPATLRLFDQGQMKAVHLVE